MLDEVSKGLEDDHRVLFFLELLICHASIELEVVHQLLVVDREDTHGGVEVLLSSMESKVHGLEVNFQLGRVLLLFGDLLLLLVPEAGLLFFETFLGETSFLLSFLVLLFLLGMDLSKLFHGHGLWLAFDIETVNL